MAAAYYAGEQRIKKQGLKCADADIYRYVREVQTIFSKTADGRTDRWPELIQGAEHP